MKDLVVNFSNKIHRKVCDDNEENAWSEREVKDFVIETFYEVAFTKKKKKNEII